MKQISVFLCLVVSASCMFLHPEPIVSLPLILDLPHDNPHYSYAYEIHHPINGDIKRQHESRDGDVVTGQYSLVQPDGVRRIVDYKANDNEGFKATVNHEAQQSPQLQINGQGDERNGYTRENNGNGGYINENNNPAGEDENTYGNRNINGYSNTNGYTNGNGYSNGHTHSNGFSENYSQENIRGNSDDYSNLNANGYANGNRYNNGHRNSEGQRNANGNNRGQQLHPNLTPAPFAISRTSVSVSPSTPSTLWF